MTAPIQHTPDPTSDSRTLSAADVRSAIEIGWIICGTFDDADRKAVRQARAAVLNRLNHLFSEYSWRMPLIRRTELAGSHRVEPVMLLEHGVTERDQHQLDFGLMMTPSDLRSHYKPFALAVVSRALDLAVISTARIDPVADAEQLSAAERVERMAGRVEVLILHSLGHLCGLSHCDDPENIMRDVNTVAELDRMSVFNDEQLTALRESLKQIADIRLEEQADAAPSSTAVFYVRGAWLNRHEILDAVFQARPWQFPWRLSRFTTAATSAAMLLVMTAETWDMAVTRSTVTAVTLLLMALLTTTIFVLTRQQLLVHRHAGRRSEQTVITNLSTVAIVGIGMSTLIVFLLTAVWLLTLTVFGPRLGAAWAVSLDEPFRGIHFLRLSLVIASLASVIGALGASFEEHHHFRHITFVDEET